MIIYMSLRCLLVWGREETKEQNNSLGSWKKRSSLNVLRLIDRPRTSEVRGLSPLDGGDALLWTPNSKVVMVGVIRSSWVWIYFKGRAVRISWWMEIRGIREDSKGFGLNN